MQLTRWVIAVLLFGCNTDRMPPDGPCPNGICIVDGGNMPGCRMGDPCDDGNACTTNDVCDDRGACAGSPMSCSTPPAASCSNADTSIVFNPQGTCSAGQCSYTQNQISCLGACIQGTGLCPNPCNGVTCDRPPATGCFASPGTCGNGACTYETLQAGGACNDGDGCTMGDVCGATGTCVGSAIVCNSPPANECVDNSLRVYTSAGAACTGGACDYPFADTSCGGGCQNGACIGACDEASCEAWALPSQPNGTRVRTCSDLSCPTVSNLPALDEAYFRCNVQPVLNTGCAQLGCHSDQTPLRRMRIYARLFSRADPLAVDGTHDDGPYNLAACTLGNCDVDPLSSFEWDWNFDTARMLAAEAASPATSELVTQPLAVSAGGVVHDGFDIFLSTNDVRYQALIDWMNGATDTNDCGGRELPANAGPVVSLDQYTPNSCVQ